MPSAVRYTGTTYDVDTRRRTASSLVAETGIRLDAVREVRIWAKAVVSTKADYMDGAPNARLAVWLRFRRSFVGRSWS